MRIRWNWGAGVALVYTAFALATVGFVIFAIAHPAALVSADYYQQSLGYDRKIEAMTNVEALGGSVDVRLDSGADRAAMLTLPAAHHGGTGTVTWYRASDAAFDRVTPLAVDRDGVQRISIDGLQPGRWRLKVEWQADGRPFYLERVVIIAP